MRTLNVRVISAMWLLACGVAAATPQEAARLRRIHDLAMEKWTLEMRLATTAEERARLAAARPDVMAAARDLWRVIGGALEQPWTIEPAAWFVRQVSGLTVTSAEGVITPAFAREREAVRLALERHHAKSPGIIPLCVALIQSGDPKVLGTLEAIHAGHPDPEVQGVAAYGAAIILRGLGDEPELLRKRLGLLRTAIIQSSEVSLDGMPLAKHAEEELYVILHLSKGRVAPDLVGTDAAGRPLKLSDHAGKVVVLLFWNSSQPESAALMRMHAEMQARFRGRPVTVVGVNQDPLETLRKLTADGQVTWPNFSDPKGELARTYRVISLPLAVVLDGERKIQHIGAPGSFAELTAEALLPAPEDGAASGR